MVKKNPEEADYFEMKFRFLQFLKNGFGQNFRKLRL